MLLELLKVLLEGFILSIKNLYFVIMIILCIIIKIYYPKFRGYMGEFWVKKELLKLPKNDYKILNDIMLEDDLGTHQIDHIIISKFGIFVIEMKNYYGMVAGNEFKDKWLQYLGKNKYPFKNPIHQNYGHIKSLERLLILENNNFISIICFSDAVKLAVKSKSCVVCLRNLIKTINSFDKPILNIDINEVSNIILNNNITDRKKRKQHVNDIKNNYTKF